MKRNKFLILTILTNSLVLAALLFISGVRAQLASSPCPMFRCDLRHTGQSNIDTSENNGIRLWSFKIDGGIESSPSIGTDGTIYIGSHSNKLYAINPDGNEKWQFYAGEPVTDTSGNSAGVPKGILSSPAVASDGTIYFATLQNYLYALTPDGKEKWKFPLKLSTSTWTSPTIGEDGTIYIGSARAKEGKDESGKIYAIRSDGIEKWHFHTEADVCPSITIALDGTIYSGNGATGKFYAINPDGSLKWVFQTGRHIESSAAIGADGTIYVGSWDNNFYALTPDGKEKWRFATHGEGIVASPAISSDGTILLNSDDGNLYAINPDGTQKWKLNLSKPTETASSPIISKDGTIYVGATESDNTFLALTPEGNVRWGINLGPLVSSSPTIGQDGTIYVANWDKLYAIGKGNIAQKLLNQLEDHSKQIFLFGSIGFLVILTVYLFRKLKK